MVQRGWRSGDGEVKNIGSKIVLKRARGGKEADKEWAPSATGRGGEHDHVQ